ncbi:MAG: PHB depolymerase family esterase [Aquabacterium sp.]
MKSTWTGLWAASMKRGLAALYKASKPRSPPALKLKTPGAKARQARASADKGRWVAGLAIHATGARRYRLFCPPGIQPGERVPMLVMLHGCGQDAQGFADSTRMNRIAAREGFITLYPEQDRLTNPQRCWNWFDTRSGRAYSEAMIIMAAIDQACALYPVDRARIAVAGLSAGASMAALLATRYPDRFKAVVMHSGVPPGNAHSTLTALGAMHGRRTVAPLPASTPAPSPGTTAPWPPLLVIHGASDKVVVASNGRDAVQAWADAVGARAMATRGVQRGQRYAMTVTDFKYKGHTVATLADIDRLGHAWSGGAAKAPFSDAKGPDASRMVWAFVSRQFRR